MGVSELIFCTSALAIAKYRMGFGIDALRTLAFIAIVFGNQATTYTNRERRAHLVIPSQPVADGVVGSRCADRLNPGGRRNRHDSAATLRGGRNPVAAAAFAFILDFAKVPVFQTPEDRLNELSIFDQTGEL